MEAILSSGRWVNVWNKVSLGSLQKFTGKSWAKEMLHYYIDMY